ncbi:MAG: YbjN domain-containing protein, partial [Chitinophagales bacterium]|nr:YbjN domain-containing protein [Chitinophagales bacterium]
LLNGFGFRYNVFDENPNKKAWLINLQLKNGAVRVIIEYFPQNLVVSIYSVFAINIPEPKRKAVAEYITRANYGLLLGNFEMDFNDGEVRFKNSYALDDTFPHSEEVLRRNFVVNVEMMDKYLPGMMAVVYGNAIPEEMILKTETASNPLMN